MFGLNKDSGRLNTFSRTSTNPTDAHCLQEMRFFGLEKDKGQLSIAELRANKQKKEQMLKSSIDVSSFGLESLQADELATAAS